MDFHFSAEEQAFRDEIRDFLDEHLPDPVPKDDPAFLAQWNKLVREKRWVGFNWPKEWGGGGGDLIRQFILKEEMSPRSGFHGDHLGRSRDHRAWHGRAARRAS